MSSLVLKLYITGQTSRSEQTVRNLRRICDTRLEGSYELAIIDVLEQPNVAERENIIATPTLIKACPPPQRRIIGDLSDTKKVIIGLQLQDFLMADHSKGVES